MSSLKTNLSLFALSAFFLVALFNPLLKKYDYGAGFPLIIIMAGLSLLLVIVEFNKKRESSKLEPALLGVFGLSVALSFVYSQTKNVGFSEVLAFCSIIPIYLALAYQKHKWTSHFLNVVVFSASLAAILGFALYLMRAEVRMVGPFFNVLYHANVWPNAFALFLLLTWPLFFRNFNYLRAIALGITLAALVLTFSRGAMIAFIGQIILLAIYFLRRFEKKSFLLLLLTVLVAVSAYFGANYLRSLNHEVIDVEERISFGNEESLTSKQERIDFWEGALDLADDHPLFGYGPFSFRYAYNPIQETFLGNADHPHNIFLKIAVENGLIAVVAFLGFLLTVLFTLLRRFSSLKKDERDMVYLMAVAVVGAAAHNMIDYNFNFAVNLLLLFVYLALIRSIISKPKVKRRANLALLMGIIVSLFAFYEGSLLVLAQFKDESYLQYSLYPRNYYLNEADAALHEGKYERAKELLDKETALNPFDAQAQYLEGIVCQKSNGSEQDCYLYFKRALELNPLNDFNYYSEYLTYLAKIEPEKLDEFVEQSLILVEQYFDYVDNNVHFTAYTPNVEAATRFILNLLQYTDDSDKNQELIYKMSKMVEKAEQLRMEKSY